MGYSHINKLLEDDKELKKLMHSLENAKVENIYIVKEILSILEDDSPYLGMLSDSNKKALCRLCRSASQTFIGEQLEDNSKLMRLYKYSMVYVYYMDATCGKRRATKGEIENGADGIYKEIVYPAGKDIAVAMNVIMWLVYGYTYCIRNIGYKLVYSDDGEVMTPTYAIITMTADEINKAIEIYGSERYEKALKMLEKYRKGISSIYTEHADDEVVPKISKKQIIKDVLDRFPRGSSDKDYRKAISLALRNDKRPLKPDEVAFLRLQYDRLKEEKADTEATNTARADDRLIKICDELELRRYSKGMSSNHFAYTIIASLKQNSFRKCSHKQLSIIMDAYKILHPDTDSNINAVEDTDDSTVNSIDDYSGIGDILEI